MIINSSIVIFAGSSPCSEADDIFPYGIKLANEHDKIVIVDTYGDHLEKCIESKPMVLHNNADELSKSLNINADSEEAKINLMKLLYNRGIKLSFITDGRNPVYASKFDFIYKVENPEVEERDPTGSGDAFVAGIAYGLENAVVFEEFLSVASALGAANASRFDTCNTDITEVNSLRSAVKVIPIGKKMKIIDDSPTID